MTWFRVGRSSRATSYSYWAESHARHPFFFFFALLGARVERHVLLVTDKLTLIANTKIVLVYCLTVTVTVTVTVLLLAAYCMNVNFIVTVLLSCC